MTEDQKWEKINSEKRKDILYANALNVSAQINTATGMTPKEVYDWAMNFFALSHAPYEKEWGAAVKQNTKTVNIDKEIEEATEDYGF